MDRTLVEKMSRMVALLVAFSLVAVACGGDDDAANGSGDDAVAADAGSSEDVADDSGDDGAGAGAAEESGDDGSGEGAAEESGDDGADEGAAEESGDDESGDDESGDDAFLAEVADNIETYLAGTWGTPPTDGPPLFEGARVMHLSCGELLPSCSEPTTFMIEVGELMGWQVDVRDLNFNPAAAGDFIAEAIAGGYDVVTTEAVDCPVIQPALLDAQAAGLPVVSFYGHDCTTPSVGGESLMIEVPLSEPWEGQWSQDERWAASKADWLINELQGDVRVITMEQADLFTPRHIGLGFDARIAECATCEIVDTIEYTFPELSDGTFAQKVAQSLGANPDANAIHFLYDGLFLVGGSVALQDSGRLGEIIVVGGEFTTINGQLFEAGLENLIMFYDHKWTAYSTLDTVNRVLNGEEPVIQGQGWEAVDAAHPPEIEDGRFRAPVDYEAAYAALWGI